jgi:hypothetical protein
MRTLRLRACMAAASLALLPGTLWAQGQAPLRHLELSGGIGFLTGSTLGQQDAELRTSTPGTPYRLFTATSRMSAVPVLDLRAGLALTSRFGIEAHAAYGHPEVRTAVSSDAENAPDLTAVERLDQYLIDGGIVIGLDEWQIAGLHPFATVGGGYLRQLHEGLVVIDTGRLFYVGGGVKRGLVVRPRGWWRAIGVRGDARLNLLSGGIEVDDRVRRHAVVSGSVFVVF